MSIDKQVDTSGAQYDRKERACQKEGARVRHEARAALGVDRVQLSFSLIGHIVVNHNGGIPHGLCRPLIKGRRAKAL